MCVDFYKRIKHFYKKKYIISSSRSFPFSISPSFQSVDSVAVYSKAAPVNTDQDTNKIPALNDNMNTCFFGQEEGLIEITPIQPDSVAKWHWDGSSSRFEAVKHEDEGREASSQDRHKRLDERALDELYENESVSEKTSVKVQSSWAVRVLQGIVCVLFQCEL